MELCSKLEAKNVGVVENVTFEYDDGTYRVFGGTVSVNASFSSDCWIVTGSSVLMDLYDDTTVVKVFLYDGQQDELGGSLGIFVGETEVRYSEALVCDYTVDELNVKQRNITVPPSYENKLHRIVAIIDKRTKSRTATERRGRLAVMGPDIKDMTGLLSLMTEESSQ